MRSTGFEVFVVERSGSGRFKPQSPRASPDRVVATACCMGYASVAVSEVLLDWTWPMKSFSGRGSGGGIENSRELRRRLAVGDTVLLDILGSPTELFLIHLLSRMNL